VWYAVVTLFGMVAMPRASTAATTSVSAGDRPAAVAVARRRPNPALTVLGLPVPATATAEMVFRP
jgi:hypothetical protein